MSKLTREEMDRIINEHFAYEAQDDVDGVAGTLTEDVEHDGRWLTRQPGQGPGSSPQVLSRTFPKS